MTADIGLQEMPATVTGQIRLATPDTDVLTDAIYKRLVQEYNGAGSRFVRELGGDKFRLQATWKQQELRQKARRMAHSLQKTVRERRAAINKLPTAAERQKARAALHQYKLKQLNDIVGAEGQFQAQTDVLAHSGIVDVQKSKVMNFQNLGPKTCDICIEIAAGNPYTITRSTTLGAKAHPSCYCEWTQDWAVDKTLLANTKREVADGEITLWDGRGRTPARGQARRRAGMMQERKGGWAGRRTEQRRLATQLEKRRRGQFRMA